MAFTRDFCEARARDAAEAACVSKLANVRERELRSEAAWRAMSDQLRLIEEKRNERLESKQPGAAGVPLSAADEDKHLLC